MAKKVTFEINNELDFDGVKNLRPRWRAQASTLSSPAFVTGLACYRVRTHHLVYLAGRQLGGELRRAVPCGREQRVRGQPAAQRRLQHGAHVALRQPRRPTPGERVAHWLQRLLPLRYKG